MMRAAALILLLLSFASAHADNNYYAAVGVFQLAQDGRDIMVGFRAGKSPWRFAYRSAQWLDKYHDPYTGNVLSNDTTRLEGVQADYLFQHDTGGSWFLGVSVVRQERTERPIYTTETGTDSVTAPYFGGGYTGDILDHGFYTMGMYLSPGTKLETHAADNSTEDNGLFDIQIMIGLRF